MRKYLKYIVIILILSAGSFCIAKDNPVYVRVGLLFNQPKVSLFSFSGLIIQEKDTSKVIAKGSFSYVVKSISYELRINGEKTTATSVTIKSSDYSSPVYLNNKPYRGVIILLLDEKGKIAVINLVDLEQYLAGVMGGEVPSDWPPEALKTQAVAARTYALYKIKNKPEKFFDVYSTDKDQVYGGVMVEAASLNKALSETRGEVITYNGSLILAYYHSTCGGKTEEGGEVFGMPEPYLCGVNDPYCEDSPVRDWMISFSQDEIRKAFKKQKIEIGIIMSIRPTLRDKSGRIRILKIVHSKGTEYMPGYEFRRIMGYRNIRSSFFDISPRGYIVANMKKQMEINDNKSNNELSSDMTFNLPMAEITIIRNKRLAIIKTAKEISVINVESDEDSKTVNKSFKKIKSSKEKSVKRKVPFLFVIKGHGWGHGVGMCQWGARGMALKGFNYKQILKYYYPGVEITLLGAQN